MYNLQIGDHWGSVVLTDLYVDTVETTHNGVTDKLPTRFASFECECGRTWVMAMSTFPGRRKMRDCGTCGTSMMGKGRITAAYIDPRTYAHLSQYARETGVTVSKAIVTLVREGVARHEATRTEESTTTNLQVA